MATVLIPQLPAGIVIQLTLVGPSAIPSSYLVHGASQVGVGQVGDVFIDFLDQAGQLMTTGFTIGAITNTAADITVTSFTAPAGTSVAFHVTGVGTGLLPGKTKAVQFSFNVS